MVKIRILVCLLLVLLIAMWVLTCKAIFLIPLFIIFIILGVCIVQSLIAIAYPDTPERRREIKRTNRTYKTEMFNKPQKSIKRKKRYLINKYGEIIEERR